MVRLEVGFIFLVLMGILTIAITIVLIKDATGKYYISFWLLGLLFSIFSIALAIAENIGIMWLFIILAIYSWILGCISFSKK